MGKILWLSFRRRIGGEGIRSAFRAWTRVGLGSHATPRLATPQPLRDGGRGRETPKHSASDVKGRPRCSRPTGSPSRAADAPTTSKKARGMLEEGRGGVMSVNDPRPRQETKGLYRPAVTTVSKVPSDAR